MPRYTEIYLTKSQRNGLQVECGDTVYAQVGTSPLLHRVTVMMSPYRTDGGDFLDCQANHRAEVWGPSTGTRIRVALDPNDNAYQTCVVRESIRAFQTTFDPFAESVQEDVAPPAFDPTADGIWMSGEDEGDDSWYTQVARSSRAMAQRSI